MIAKFIEPHDKRWNQVLSTARHDFYHLPEFASFSAKHEGGKPSAFYAEDNGISFLMPLLVKDLPDYLSAPYGWLDAMSPYGYPAPIMSENGNTADFARFLSIFKQLGREQSIVSAFIRLHPLLAQPLPVLEELGKTVNHSKIVYSDLSLSTEKIWSQVRQNHKRDIKKLAQSGFRVSIDDGTRLLEFANIYSMTMERLSAKKYFRYPSEYFADLAGALGGRTKLVTATAPDGRLASGGLYIETDGIMQYHLGATDNDYLKQAPSKLVYDFAWRFAKEQGCRYLFLGGAAGGDSSSLLKFKLGFSKSQADLYTYRIILDDDKYVSLCARQEQADSAAGDFFPIYRAPRA